MSSTGSHDPGDFPEPVREALLKAVDHYMINLDLVQELGDRAAEGRAAGNLGNTFYLLGNFNEAINFHQQVGFSILVGLQVFVRCRKILVETRGITPKYCSMNNVVVSTFIVYISSLRRQLSSIILIGQSLAAS